jgi:hypothetical protein
VIAKTWTTNSIDSVILRVDVDVILTIRLPSISSNIQKVNSSAARNYNLRVPSHSEADVGRKSPSPVPGYVVKHTFTPCVIFRSSLLHLN